ncbi:MAG: O-antigen ligase family protein [bacterium]
MDNSQDLVERITLWLWVVFILLLFPRKGQSIRDGIIILSPILIVSRFGFSWLKELNLRSWSLWGFVLFFLGTGIPQFISPDVYRGADAFRGNHLKWIAIVFSLMFVLRRKENLKPICWAVVGTVFLGMAFGYYNYFTPVEYHLYQPQRVWEPGSRSPLTAFGQWHTYYATGFSVLLPIVLAFTLHNLRSSSRMKHAVVLPAVVFLSSLPILWLTTARGPQVALFVSVLTMVLVLFFKSSVDVSVIKAISVSLLLIIAVMVLLYVFGIGEGAISVWDVKSIASSVEGRMKQWTLSFHAAKDYWLFGLNFHPESLHNITNRERLVDYSLPEHNIYLFFLIRTGIVGLTSFLIFSGLLFFEGLNILMKKKTWSRTLFLSSYLSVYLGSFLLLGIIYPLNRTLIFFVLLALLLSIIAGKNWDETNH